MTTPDAMKKRFEQLNVADLTEDTLIEQRGDLVNYNRQQMLSGLASDGALIGEYRPPDGYYARRKNQMNAKPGLGNVDLRLTHDFQDSMVVFIESPDIIFTSDDEKTPKLTGNYGERIFGLTRESKSDYIDRKFYPTFSKKVSEIVKLDFK